MVSEYSSQLIKLLGKGNFYYNSNTNNTRSMFFFKIFVSTKKIYSYF